VLQKVQVHRRKLCYKRGFFYITLSLYILVSLPDDGRMNDRHMSYEIIITERTVFVFCVVWVTMLLTN
jgi:hypothetical protein